MKPTGSGGSGESLEFDVGGALGVFWKFIDNMGQRSKYYKQFWMFRSNSKKQTTTNIASNLFFSSELHHPKP